MRCLSCDALSRASGATFCFVFFHVETDAIHVLHARCVVETLARGAASVPLRCLVAGCGVRHTRQEVLEAAVQPDPGLRRRAARVGGEVAGDANLRRPAQTEVLVRMGPEKLRDGATTHSIDAVFPEHLQQRFATGKKVQPQLVGSYGPLSVLVPDISKPRLGRARAKSGNDDADFASAGDAVLFAGPSPNGRIKRRQRFALVESSGIPYSTQGSKPPRTKSTELIFSTTKRVQTNAERCTYGKLSSRYFPKPPFSCGRPPLSWRKSVRRCVSGGALSCVLPWYTINLLLMCLLAYTRRGRRKRKRNSAQEDPRRS